MLFMKKIVTLVLVAGLVFGSIASVNAIEFEAKGQWLMNFEYGAGGSLSNKVGRSRNNVSSSNTYGYGAGLNGAGPDNFEVSQRVHLQLDAIASETLSGKIFFEMGNQVWGRANTGGALGTDGVVAEVKSAYIDWIVPDTKIQVRMGLQYVAIPSYTFDSSQVFNNDVAGISANYQFNDNVGVTFVWARPYNDNYSGNADGDGANAFDNIDMFTLVFPMNFSNFRIAPWVSYAMIGKNTFARDNVGNITGPGSVYDFSVANGLYPAIKRDINDDSFAYGSAFWIGVTGDVTTGSGFRFAWDINYGAQENGVSWQKREGYYLDVLAEYKMDWGTPGLYAWYGSGDDGSIKNGSERMPSMSADGTDQRASISAYGSPYIGRGAVIAAQWTGTWGIGARLKDMSFLEDLKHTLRVNYMRGTNSTTMAKYILDEKDSNIPYGRTLGYDTGANGFGYNIPTAAYLTTDDSALEIGLTSTYKIYDNLTMYVDMAYIFMFIDKDVWGRGTIAAGQPGAGDTFGGMSSTDPWNINATFVYSF